MRAYTTTGTPDAIQPAPERPAAFIDTAQGRYVSAMRGAWQLALEAAAVAKAAMDMARDDWSAGPIFFGPLAADVGASAARVVKAVAIAVVICEPKTPDA